MTPSLDTGGAEPTMESHMSVAFTLEPLTESLKEELQPLLEKHWQEIAHDLTIPLQPRWDVYFALQAAGALNCFIARDDGKLIGYAVFFINFNLHYGSSLQAQQDIVFIEPALRRGTLGTRLLKYAEAQLKAAGVQVVLHHVKAKHNWGPMLERLGYSLADLIYVKRVN